MKKALTVILLIVVLAGLVGCGSDRLKSESITFFVPKNAVTTVRVVINPAFNLYLDTEDNVVALEPLNDDAKAIEKELDVVDKSFTDAVVAIVKTAKENNFINDENKDFTIKLVETKESGKESLVDDSIEVINDALAEKEMNFAANVDNTPSAPTGAYSIIKTNIPLPYRDDVYIDICQKIDFDIENYWGIRLIDYDEDLEDVYIIYNEEKRSLDINNGGPVIFSKKYGDDIYVYSNCEGNEHLVVKYNWDGTLTVISNDLVCHNSGVMLEKGDVLVPHIEYGEKKKPTSAIVVPAQ